MHPSRGFPFVRTWKGGSGKTPAFSSRLYGPRLSNLVHPSCSGSSVQSKCGRSPKLVCAPAMKTYIYGGFSGITAPKRCGIIEARFASVKQKSASVNARRPALDQGSSGRSLSGLVSFYFWDTATGLCVRNRQTHLDHKGLKHSSAHAYETSSFK